MKEPDNVQSAMLEILKRIQADVSTVRGDVSDVKADVIGLKGRMDKLEALVRKQGRDSAAMLVMMRGTVGIYDERMKVIEEDVRLLMERD
jgi:N-methylhydantoinase B/oxoprolinase/acetone carboxylase alpha subunit